MIPRTIWMCGSENEPPTEWTRAIGPPWELRYFCNRAVETALLHRGLGFVRKLDPVQRADLWRVATLEDEGGFYFDRDTVPGAGALGFLESVRQHDLVLSSMDPGSPSSLTNAHFAAESLQRFLAFWFAAMVQRLHVQFAPEIGEGRFAAHVSWSSGPGCLTDAFRDFCLHKPTNGILVLRDGAKGFGPIAHRSDASWLLKHRAKERLAKKRLAKK